MNPFPAWLAMSIVDVDCPLGLYTQAVSRGATFKLFSIEGTAVEESPGPPQPVIVVPDTEENRKKLGMEE